jgi:hypothetical protein
MDDIRTTVTQYLYGDALRSLRSMRKMSSIQPVLNAYVASEWLTDSIGHSVGSHTGCLSGDYFWDHPADVRDLIGGPAPMLRANLRLIKLQFN